MTKTSKSILFLRNKPHRAADFHPIFPYAVAEKIIAASLKEDDAVNDVTSKILFAKDVKANAVLLCKEKGVATGLPAAFLAFKGVDRKITFDAFFADGAEIKKGDVLAEIRGSARSILSAERVALNFLQHLSGIATRTRACAQKLKGLQTKLLDTRKTTPGLRALEKYAVVCGGGLNHRFSLSDGILIKDNHLQIYGSIKECVRRAKKNRQVVEVEVNTLKELCEILSLDELPEIVMLDNISLEDMRKAVKMCRGKIKLEASGNVTLKTLRRIALTGVDFVSSGSLTHSVKALDISLDII